jgi:hypothetical protein
LRAGNPTELGERRQHYCAKDDGQERAAVPPFVHGSVLLGARRYSERDLRARMKMQKRPHEDVTNTLLPLWLLLGYAAMSSG